MNKELIQKYNIPGPRYTSYPTVPFWDKEGISMEHWKETTVRAFKESNDQEGSVYIFIYPFARTYVHFVHVIKELPKGTVLNSPILKPF